MGNYGRGSPGPGYEYPRMDCPTCGKKSVAYSVDPDGRTVWMRRHNRARGVRCDTKHVLHPDIAAYYAGTWKGY